MTTLTIERQLDQVSPQNSFQSLRESAIASTRAFLEKCRLAWEAKQAGVNQWRDAKELIGWNNHTAQPFLKLWQWVQDWNINIQNLLLLDSQTLLALRKKKYEEIWYNIKSKQMTVKQVREAMSKENKRLKKEKDEAAKSAPPRPITYRRNRYGIRTGFLELNAELVDRIESEYKSSGQPWHIFSQQFFTKEPPILPVIESDQAWYEAQEEMMRELEVHTKQDDNQYELMREASKLDLEISKYQGLQLDATESMFYNDAIQKREKLRLELRNLGVELYQKSAATLRIGTRIKVLSGLWKNQEGEITAQGSSSWDVMLDCHKNNEMPVATKLKPYQFEII